MTAFSSAFSLAGKRALVTGCDQGIGQAIALGLAEAGADIIGVFMHTPAGGETEVAVQALGREYRGYQADFGKLDELRGFIKEVQADFPVIDILLNNAGIIRRAPPPSTPMRTGTPCSASTSMRRSAWPAPLAARC